MGDLTDRARPRWNRLGKDRGKNQLLVHSSIQQSYLVGGFNGILVVHLSHLPQVPLHRQHAGGPVGNDLEEGRHDRIERETESLFLLGEVKEDVL